MTFVKQEVKRTLDMIKIFDKTKFAKYFKSWFCYLKIINNTAFIFMSKNHFNKFPKLIKI